MDKSEISPHDRFVSTYPICDIRYQKVLGMDVGDGDGDDVIDVIDDDADDGRHIVLPPRRQVSVTAQGVRQVAAAKENTE